MGGGRGRRRWSAPTRCASGDKQNGQAGRVDWTFYAASSRGTRRSSCRGGTRFAAQPLLVFKARANHFGFPLRPVTACGGARLAIGGWTGFFWGGQLSSSGGPASIVALLVRLVLHPTVEPRRVLGAVPCFLSPHHPPFAHRPCSLTTPHPLAPLPPTPLLGWWSPFSARTH